MAEARTRSMTEVRIGDAAEHTVLTTDDLKSALEADEVSSVFKYGVAERNDPGGVVKEVHTLSGGFLKEGRPTSSAVITTASVDRDWDIVHTTGMVLTSGYLKNPVVMPMHQYREVPLGFTEKVAQYTNHAVARWQWATEVPETDAARYYALWTQHVLNCTSIGFTPLNKESWEWNDHGGIDWLMWELLEHSIVSIPANQEAIRTDGVKEYMRVARDMIFDGPSPIMKMAFEKALHQKVYPSAVAATEDEPEEANNASNVKEATAPEEKDAHLESAGTEETGSEKVTDEQGVYDTPERVLSAFESGAISRDEAAELIREAIVGGEWAKEKLMELSLKVLKRKTEV